MSYHQQLHPWCIVRFLPNMQHRVIARLRRRNDAEAHLRILRQNAPSLRYAIVFDPGKPSLDSKATHEEQSPQNQKAES